MAVLPEIVVHHLEQARAVLKIAQASGYDVQLRSTPDASAYAGVGYLHALGEAVEHDLLIDCRDDAGLAMAAIRAGCRKIIFCGHAEIHQRLVDMAVQKGAAVRLETTPNAHCLRLLPDDDGSEQTRRWLEHLWNVHNI